ncbi:MAG: DUF4263 domain-containing protein [Anaerolineales bacterium]|nr:DUF4263 domain-containing protein [Anaerolineales bacterium]
MLKETKNKEGQVVWRYDNAKKYYEYLFVKDSAQGKLIKKLVFKDTSKKPSGFSQSGYGFRGALKPLSFLLRDTFTEIEEIVVANHASSIKGKKINFNKKEYDSMVATLGMVYKENSNRLSHSALMEMANIFPRKFKTDSKTSKYVPGTLNQILSKKGIVSQLSTDDISKLVEILPPLMDRSAKAKSGLLSQIRFTDLRDKSNKLELKNIIDWYDKLLKRKAQKENDWQEFFKKNILFFNSSYINLIDRANIGFSITIPDFLLIDQFQFVDVFEIKRPDFKCLNYDKSHDNYYWSSEASQAIAQVEKYIFELENHANGLITTFKNNGIEVNLVRPRGYVLISKREMLDTKGQKAYKLLNNSLKNVQVIFFDDFLNNLKNKYTIISKSKRKSA